MNILFIGVACTSEAIEQSDRKYYKGKSTVRPQQYFDLNLVKGLSLHASVEAISEPPVASYPKSECILYNRKSDIISQNLKVKYISLINIFGLKTMIISFTLFLEVIKFCLKTRKVDSAIVLGYLSLYTYFPAKLVAFVFKRKVIAMVPDIPDFSYKYKKTDNKIVSFLISLFIKISKFESIDGYVMLTKQMNEIINGKKKPSVVMEGFISEEDVSFKSEYDQKQEKRIVMYAGTLHEKFGIKKLIDAFNLLKDKNIELHIYGDGDYLHGVIEACKSNSSINYQGTKSKEEILKIEQQAALLINPRPSGEEFTKYSFPSKTLEYMASGTPLLSTKLKGIPNEYYDYAYWIEDETVEGIAKTIERIFLTDDFIEKGLKAKKFVLKYKNNIVQSEKVFNFIKYVCGHNKSNE